MAINEKSRNLHQPSRLTCDLADKVRALGLAQRFQRIRELGFRRSTIVRGDTDREPGLAMAGAFNTHRAADSSAGSGGGCFSRAVHWLIFLLLFPHNLLVLHRRHRRVYLAQSGCDVSKYFIASLAWLCLSIIASEIFWLSNSGQNANGGLPVT